MNTFTKFILAAAVLATFSASGQSVCASMDGNRLASLLTGPSDAWAHATFAVDRDHDVLTYRIDAGSLAGITGARIERVSGAQVVDLTAGNQTFIDGVLEGSASVAGALLAEIHADPSAFAVTVTTQNGALRGALNGRGITLMTGELTLESSGGAGKVSTDVASNATGVFSLGFVDDDPSGDDVRVDYDLMADSIEDFDGASVVLVDGDFSEDIIDLGSADGFADGRVHGTVRLSREELARIVEKPSGYRLQFRSPTDGTFSGRLMEAVTTFIAAFGRTQNAHGNLFNSDLRLYNPSRQPANVLVQFYANGGTSALAGHSAILRLEPGQSRVIPDAALTLFGSTARLGALRVVTSAGVIVDSEIMDSVRGGGVGTTAHNARFGQLVSGQGGCSAVTRGVLTSVAVTSGLRTNVLLGNPGTRPAAVRLELRDAQGRLLDARTMRLGAHAHLLMPLGGPNGLFSNTTGELRHAVVLIAADTPLFLGASAIDNNTGEARFSAARPL